MTEAAGIGHYVVCCVTNSYVQFDQNENYDTGIYKSRPLSRVVLNFLCHELISFLLGLVSSGFSPSQKTRVVLALFQHVFEPYIRHLSTMPDCRRPDLPRPLHGHLHGSVSN